MFKELPINEQIRADMVRLVGDNGEQLGIISLKQAIEMADKQSLDVVLMNSSSSPAVCKLMDYGKFKFDSLKKEKELKKNQKVSELKEIQLSMTIDKHDMETKAKHGNKFLQSGDKVKIALRMKGRQQAYTQNAITVVKDFYAMLQENGTIDKEPEVLGKNIFLIVQPKKV